MIENNIKEYLTFLLDPYLSTLDLSMFGHRISDNIVEYVASRCIHLTTLKLGKLAIATESNFKFIVPTFLIVHLKLYV